MAANEGDVRLTPTGSPVLTGSPAIDGSQGIEHRWMRDGGERGTTLSASKGFSAARSDH